MYLLVYIFSRAQQTVLTGSVEYIANNLVQNYLQDLYSFQMVIHFWSLYQIQLNYAGDIEPLSSMIVTTDISSRSTKKHAVPVAAVAGAVL